MSHDEALVAKVAEVLDDCEMWRFSGLYDEETGDALWECSTHDSESTVRDDYCPHTEHLARAVLDALDLPGRERRAKAEALRDAADDMERIFRAGNLLGGPTDDWLRLRAAEIDPEEEP